MSIINRMLSDLERRGQPSAAPTGRSASAARPRWSISWRALLLTLLAVLLLALASLLWLQRGPQLLAMIDAHWQASMAGFAGDDDAAEAAATTPDPVDTEVVLAALETAESEVPEAEVTFEAVAEPEPQPPTEVAVAASVSETQPEAVAEPEPEPETQTEAEPEPATTEPVDETGTASTTADTRVEGEGRLVVRRNGGDEGEARARRLYNQAREAWSAGDTHRARRLLAEALEHDPRFHPAREMLAALHIEVGAHRSAFDLLTDGLQHAPQRLGFAIPFARLLIQVEQFERAARVLDNASVEGQGNPQYHALVATVARRLGEHEQAATEYTRALELDAGQGTWWIGLGISLAEMGHDQQASAAFREARETGSLGPDLDRWARGRIDVIEAAARE